MDQVTMGDSSSTTIKISKDHLSQVREAIQEAALGWYPGQDVRIQACETVIAPQKAYAPVNESGAQLHQGLLRFWWRLLRNGSSRQDDPPQTPFRSWVVMVDDRPMEFLKVLLLGNDDPEAQGLHDQWCGVLRGEKEAFEWLLGHVANLSWEAGEGVFLRGIATGVGSACGVGTLSLGVPGLGVGAKPARSLCYLRRPFLPWPSLSSFEPSSEAVEGVFEAVLRQVEKAFGVTSGGLREMNRKRFLRHVRESALICASPWSAGLSGGMEGGWGFVFPDPGPLLDLPAADKGSLPILFVLEPSRPSPGGIQGWCDGGGPDPTSEKIAKAFEELKAQMTGPGAGGNPSYPYLIGWLPSTWRFEWKELWA